MEVGLLNRQQVKSIIMVILLLGVLGFLNTLFTQPLELLKQFVYIALFIGIFYFLVRMFSRRRMGGKGNSAYMNAVKQSNKRFNNDSERKKNHLKGLATKKHSIQSTKKTSRSTVQKKKNHNHLTVIEGKKGKKKNRAFF